VAEGEEEGRGGGVRKVPIKVGPLKTISALCPDCGGVRHCDVLFEKEKRIDEDDGNFYIGYWSSYTILECRGCEKIFFQHSHSCSEDTDNDGVPITKTDYYPKKVLRQRKIAKNIDLPYSVLSYSLENLVCETYAAINNGLPIIAAIALRTLCDQILIIKVGDQGGFAKNLDECVKCGHISEKYKEIIKSALEIGHAAVHRGYSPSMKEVLAALDIVENTTEQLLVHEHKATALTAKVPPRKKL